LKFIGGSPDDCHSLAAMGFSKKKSKNFAKTSSRVGAKAKNKVKFAKQIEGRKDLQASKRKAAAATGKAGGKAKGDDDLREIKSVDALFASMGNEDDDASDLIRPDDEDSDDESSAGAFHDVGDDDGEDEGPVRGVVEELDDEELGPDAGARHEEELKAIKEKDPEFYKFLIEQDKSLLNFQAPDDDEEQVGGDDDEGLQGEDVEGKGAGPQAKVLTRERLERIQASAKDSWTACKAALNVFHTAVRSIEHQEQPGADDDDDNDDEENAGKKGKRRRKKNADKKPRRGLFRIDDEAIFSEVIEWSIANLLPLLRHHAGELRPASGDESGRKGKKHKKKSQKDAALAAVRDGSSGPVDPTRYARWSRVRVLVHIFWEETFFLLNNLVAQQMLEFVLRHCSNPEALSWLWPFKPARQRYIKRCCTLWSTASAHNVRLLSFLFLRNSAAMVMHMPEGGKSGEPQLEALLRSTVRSFAEVASRGYSWKSLNTFRFMENCMIELLRLDDSTAYRLGYVCLRQLALILRNACVSTSQGGGGGASGKGGGDSGEKAKKKKQVAAQQQAQVLLGWPFVRAISLWTKAVSTVPALKPLAYPLSMVIMGAVKHKLTSLQHFPFVYHCLLSLNRLGSTLEVFVPISSHLLKAFGVLQQAMESMHKKGTKGGEKQTLDSTVKAPEMEVCLRLSEGQLASSLSLEAVGNSLCFLFIDHLGLLSQSPAFPELISPIMLHLRKHSKHCRSEPLRRQLKVIIEKAEETAAKVRVRREALTEVPDAKKFLVFEADGPIGKARAEVLKRRAAEERLRVQSELQESSKAAEAGDAGAADTNATGKESAKNGKKRKGSAEEDEAASGKPAKGKKAKKQRSAGETARAAGALRKTDKVEEMDFESGED